jgi:hypothetical protein
MSWRRSSQGGKIVFVIVASLLLKICSCRWHLSNAPWNVSVEVVGPHLGIPPIADFAKHNLISSNTANNNPSRLVMSFDEYVGTLCDCNGCADSEMLCRHPQVTRKHNNQYRVHCICGDTVRYDEVSPNLRDANEVWVFHTSVRVQRLQKMLPNTKVNASFHLYHCAPVANIGLV